MKNKLASNTKVQLNGRVESVLKDAVVKVSERAKIPQETILSDAIRAYYEIETPDSSRRRKLCLATFQEITFEENAIEAMGLNALRAPTHPVCNVAQNSNVLLHTQKISKIEFDNALGKVVLLDHVPPAQILRDVSAPAFSLASTHFA